MNAGLIQQVNIDQEMREAYMDYAMSVIVSRALPDARDGLKPVHRRILYAMQDMGIRSDSAYKKSARIVGEVLGKYHPHGDAAVYEAMVRMAQDFSLRYMLVDGQGNFGSIDGDGAAAMRYTEARMAELGDELMVDIDKDTVDFVENFDGSLTEPAVLPSAIPNLLINGSSGIAVGMSTSIPPHNMGEVCDALVYMLDKWDKLDDVTIDDLMTFVKGPDFPTGGIIYAHDDNADDDDPLISAYATGRGKIIVRAKIHIEDMGRGKARFIVSELPYQTNKSTLIERIASLANTGKLEGLADLRDESDRQGLRLVIELQRGVDPEKVLERLFKLTPLQDTFSIRMLALVNNEPRLLSLKQALKVFLDHRLEVIRRRSEYELQRAEARAHILEGLLKALDKIDETIAIIRKSRNVETARSNLEKSLKITEVQAQAILDMQLRRLASLERKKIKDEHDEKVKLIKYLQELLGSPAKMRGVVAEELESIKIAYGDARRTIITDSTTKESGSMLMPQENTWVTLTVDGKLGRTFDDQPFKITTDVKEPPRFLQDSNTSDIIYLFTKSGKAASLPVHQLPQLRDLIEGEGAPFQNLSVLSASEEIAAMLTLPPGLESGYLFLATRGAQVKRVRVEDLPGLTSNEFTVMNVGDDDELGWVLPTTGNNEVILVTAYGQAIRFKEDDVRPTGLPAGGMRGIKLSADDDKLVGLMLPTDEYQHVWNITADGVAKVSPIDDYPTQGRAGSGVITMRLPTKESRLAAATIGRLDDNIIVLTNKHKPKYMRLGLAPLVKRGRAGGDYIISMSRKNEAVAAVVNYMPRVTMPEVTEADAEPA